MSGKFIRWLAVFLATFVVMALLHKYGTYERGYPAIGGEALIIFIPIILLAVVHEEKKYLRRTLAQRTAKKRKELTDHETR